MSERGRALVLVSLAQLLAMSLWFGVSAVAPAIAAEWRLTAAAAAWLTVAVQLGFVAGTLISALLSLADLVNVRTLFAISAALGALANLLLVLRVHHGATAIVLRFVTGACLAGVYPPGMKIIATWFRQGRGLALGVLVGALTLGKASPYLINVAGASSWRVTAGIPSLLALIAGAIVLLLVKDGPDALPPQAFDLDQIGLILRNRGVRLANFGYFGHMWELYAMWTWAPVMLRQSFLRSGSPRWEGELAAFVVIGSGAIGCVVAGRLADRFGRSEVASTAMVMSGCCCLLVGFCFGRAPWLMMIVAAIWGASVVADSAQFSACVTELADPRYIGTALTFQTCIGFLITSVSIQAMPLAVAAAGWRYAFVLLAPGPVLGTIAMLRLRTARLRTAAPEARAA